MRSSVWHRIGYILFVTQFIAVANTGAQKNIEISQFVQFNTIAGKGDYAPFLLTANRQGISSLDCMNGYARYGIGISGCIGNSAWRYDAGADVVAGYNLNNGVALQQLNAGLSWKWLRVDIGLKERFAEMRGNASANVVGTVYTPDNIYYSFQRHLAMLGEYSDEEFPAYYMAEFDKEGNSLTMYNFYEYPGLQGISDKEKLKRYFIFGDTVRFSIEALDDDLLVMSSGGMRYCFSKW